MTDADEQILWRRVVTVEILPWFLWGLATVAWACTLLHEGLRYSLEILPDKRSGCCAIGFLVSVEHAVDRDHVGEIDVGGTVIKSL